jgi:autotransporter-associated beta strand protein
VLAATDAHGGSGTKGAGPELGTNGANAKSNASAISGGDDHSVTVHGSALGGNGEDGTSQFYGGSGGDAYGTSTGTASGNSAVIVTDMAVGGVGGAYSHSGGSASSSAAGYNAGALSVSVTASAVGGISGPDGSQGGTATVRSALGLSSGSGTVSVTASQTGGAGGKGVSGALGGNGANSSLSNAVSGSTAGPLSLTQIAKGGNSGGSDTGAAGIAGSASSSLTFTTTCASLNGFSTAIGGYGGNGGTASGGGAASASISLTNLNAVMAMAQATGGSGGLANNHQIAADGAAVAHAAASGISGYANAQAATSGGLFKQLSVTANAPVIGHSTAESRALVNQAAPAQSLAAGLSAASFATGLPLASDAQAAVSASPGVQSRFAISGTNNTTLGLLVLGGAYPGTVSGASASYSSTANMSIDVSKLSATHNLEIGLVNPTFSGSGFDQLRFVVQSQGAVLVNQTFATPSAAQAFFQDQVLDLGGISSSVKTLNLSIALTVTTQQVGAGFNTGLLVGNVAPANLTWSGTSSVWDSQKTQDWLKGGSPSVFFAGDSVSVGDAGPASINIQGNVQPAAIAVSSSRDISLGGGGSVVGSGGLTKSGTGTLTITTSNAYTGGTSINAGKLIVDSSLLSPITVNGGGTLGGTGNLTSVVVSPGGTLAPGDGLGSLHLSGSLVLAPNCGLEYGLDTPSTSDMVTCSVLILNGQQFSDFRFAWTPNLVPGSYDLIQFGSLGGSGLGANNTGTIGDYPANLAIQGNDLVLNVVPEPSSLTLLGAAVLGLVVSILRRCKRTTQ